MLNLLEMDVVELAQFFGVEQAKVVVKREIPMDTPAAELGME